MLQSEPMENSTRFEPSCQSNEIAFGQRFTKKKTIYLVKFKIELGEGEKTKT